MEFTRIEKLYAAACLFIIGIAGINYLFLHFNVIGLLPLEMLKICFLPAIVVSLFLAQKISAGAKRNK